MFRCWLNLLFPHLPLIPCPLHYARNLALMVARQRQERQRLDRQHQPQVQHSAKGRQRHDRQRQDQEDHGGIIFDEHLCASCR